MVTSAAEEERFSRKKYDPNFPELAIRWCLDSRDLNIKDLDYIGFYDKPITKFFRILETYVARAPTGFNSFASVMPVWLREKLWVDNIIRDRLNYDGEIVYGEHHISHASSAFFASDFSEAAILTADGVGEWATTTMGVGTDNKVELTDEIRFPHSLGLLYSAFTYYLGFSVNADEYKVMGAAPYGKPIYTDLINTELIDVREDGSFRLNMKYFPFTHDFRMINEEFERLFGHPARMPGSQMEEFHFNVASSIQQVLENILVRIVNHLHEDTGVNNLCMAGGVALNCVANSKILKQGPFQNIFIQPASGDAGGAVGIATHIYYSMLGNSRTVSAKTGDEEMMRPGEQPRALSAMTNAYLGPAFTDEEIGEMLREKEATYHQLARDALVENVAQYIADGNVIGWFQGRMEFGPRALGNRSILADPRNPHMRDIVNEKVKKRETFRPFAPSILEDRNSQYFDLRCLSPYMLLVGQVKNDSIPAVTHVDGSARIQTVARNQNPLYYDLISEFCKLTEVPVVLNTSFNMAGEPIVCSPDDAHRTFMATAIDYLILGSFVLSKSDQVLPGRRAEGAVRTGS